MVKTGVVSIGTSPTAIYTASGRTIIEVLNGNAAAVGTIVQYRAEN